MAGTKRTLTLGKASLPVVGTAGLILGVALIACVLFGVMAFLGFITMILIGILHAEVALGIPAFSYWASFWITVSLSYVASYFRSSK